MTRGPNVSSGPFSIICAAVFIFPSSMIQQLQHNMYKSFVNDCIIKACEWPIQKRSNT